MLLLAILACSDPPAAPVAPTAAPRPEPPSPAILQAERVGNPGGPVDPDEGGTWAPSPEAGGLGWDFKKPLQNDTQQIWDGSTAVTTAPKTTVGDKVFHHMTLEQSFSPDPLEVSPGVRNVAHAEVAFHCKTRWEGEMKTECPYATDSATIGRAAPDVMRDVFDKGIESLGGEWHTVERSCLASAFPELTEVAGTETLRAADAAGGTFACLKDAAGKPVGIRWRRTPDPSKPTIVYTDWAVLPGAWPIGNQGTTTVTNFASTKSLPQLVVAAPADCPVPFPAGKTTGTRAAVWLSDWTRKVAGNRKQGGTYVDYNPFEAHTCKCAKDELFTCPVYP